MRSKDAPLRPSRSVFTIGIPPATEASKLSATPCRSASAASFCPCAARSALFAVTTGLPAASAVSTASLAGPDAPPITSTNTSIAGSCASATGSLTQRNFLESNARFLLRARALIATTSMPRPQRASNLSCPSSRSCTTALPTVPSPARPTFSGKAITRRPSCSERRRDHRRVASGTTLCSISGPVSRKRRMLRAAWRMRCSFSTSAMRT
jgi:hypothetical protein